MRNMFNSFFTMLTVLFNSTTKAITKSSDNLGETLADSTAVMRDTVKGYRKELLMETFGKDTELQKQYMLTDEQMAEINKLLEY